MRTENKHHLIENKDFNMHSLPLVIVDTIKSNSTKMYIIKKIKSLRLGLVVHIVNPNTQLGLGRQREADHYELEVSWSA